MFPLSIPEETSSAEISNGAAKLRMARRMLCILGFALLFGGAKRGFGATDATPSKEKLVESYGKVPLSFEPNRGQTDGRVQFLSRGPGYGIFLTPGEAVLAFKKGKAAGQSGGQSVLQMKLVGADTSAAAEAEDKLPGTANYMRGSDPAKWATKVPTYQRVKYAGVYPGVDLVFYGNQRQLEYDFVVAPGRGAGKIALEFTGATPKVDADGNLVLGADGAAKFHKPVVYQMLGGERVAVAGAYEVHGQRVTFRLGKYDHAKELVIDPVVTYLTYLGGSGTDQIGGIAVDASGATYVTGTTTSTDFPLKGAYQSSFPSGHESMFVTKLNQSGTSLVYSTYLVSDEDTYGTGIAVDSSGSAYVVGESDGNGFPVTDGAFQTLCGAEHDAQGNRIDGCGPGGSDISGVLAKLSADGSGLVYATYLSGNNVSFAAGVAVDPAGEAYVTGVTNSYCGPGPYSASTYESFQCFPTTNGSPQSTTSTPSNASNEYSFFTKFDAAGATLVYSAILGPDPTMLNQSVIGEAVAVDANGLGYITGLGGNALYTTDGSLQSQGAVNGNSAFVAKFDPSAQKLVYSTYLGGQNAPTDSGYGIAADANGNAYVAGSTNDCDFPTTTGAYETEARYAPTDTAHVGQCKTGFVAKLNSGGSALVWATYLGDAPLANDNTAAMFALALGSDGSVYVAGTVQGGGYPAVNPVLPQQNTNSVSTVTHLSADGSSALFSSTVGGPSQSTDGGTGVAVDSTGAIYLAGNTLDPYLPTTNNVIQPAFGGGGNGTYFDGFIAKISPANPPQPSNGLTTNLLANPGAELGSLADWTIGGNGTPQVDTGTFDTGINPHTGTYDFVGGYSSSTDSLSQTVSVIQQGITAAQVDGGTLFAKISFWEQGLNQGSPSDDGSVTLTFLNATNGTISTVTSAVVDSHDGTWANLVATYPIPVGTRSITYAMNFIKNELTDNDAFIDDNSLSIVTDTGLTIFPGRLHFGNVPVGSTSSSQQVTVTNQQTTTINISQIVSELGSNPSDFIQTNNCPTALTAGSSCTLTITFVPDGVGAKSAGIAINDDNVPPLQQVAVDGTGTGGILQVNPGNLKAIAGNGTTGDTGDGGQAILAELNQPNGVAFDPSGNLYIADDQANVIRKVDTTGKITTFAGVGANGFAGDGGLATQAELSIPFSVASDAAGNIYIQDTGNSVIRKVTATTGIITTFAGTPGIEGHSGDGGPATAAEFNQNQGARFDSAGNFYIPQCQGASIRKIDTAGNISTVAGNFTEGFSGDGGQATAAELQCPSGVTIDKAGNFYIADEFNSVIRKVNTQGIISTIAGTPGVAGFSGDGGAATSATFNEPNDVVIDAAGNLYVADAGNNRVRKIDTNGVITTVSGGLNSAGSAAVNTPLAVTLDTANNVYFSDAGNSKIEEIFPQGTQPFPATQVGSTSAAQTLTLSNIGNVDVTLASDGAFNTSGNAGDFALSPGSCAGGAVLTAGGGACSVSITFTPTAVGQRTLTVGISDNALNTPQSFSIGGMGTAAQGSPVAPTITWAMPAAITTATPLSGTQLDATATDSGGTTVPGTFVYTPAAGAMLAAGTQTLSVTFTPTDTAAFTTATKTTTIVVTQASGGTGGTATATTTALAVTSGGSAATTVAAGGVVVLTATVKAGTTAVAPGEVAFCDATGATCTDIHLLGTAELITSRAGMGTATYKFVPGLGVHSYRAVFLGTNTYGASASATMPLTVTGTYPTATTIAQSGTTGNYTLKATTVGAGPYPVQAPTQSVTINLGQSAQNYVLTGTGPSTIMGATYGNYYNTQGSCVTSGATTTCDLTGNFTSTTSAYASGTYDFQTVFTGSISSAITSQTQYPVGTQEPNDFQYSGFAPSLTMTLKLIVAGGDAYSIPLVANGNFDPNLDNINFADTSPVCGGTSLGTDPCQQDYVGTIAGATYSSPATGLVQFEMPSPPTLVGPTGTISFEDTSNANAVLGTGALGASAAALVFNNSASLNTGASGGIPLVGDFNGDGKMDLAVANSYSSGLTLYLGNGDGTFADGTSTSTTGSPHVLAVGDFNGDGIADIAVSLENFDSTSAVITVLLGSGNGTFTTSTSSISGLNATAMLAGDFNGDGVLDLAVVDSTTQTLTVLLGKGDGTFSASGSSIAAPSSNASLAAGDFNGDGKLDLLATSYSNGVQILLGQGDGTFVAGANPLNASGYIAVVAGDFNGDGKVDVAIANFVNNNVSIFLSNGDGTFALGATPAATQATSLAIGDFNGDGKVDLAVGNQSGGSLTVLLGQGDGTFTQGGLPAATDSSSLVAAGDFNGDGLADIVVSGGTDSAVLLSQVTETATATTTVTSLSAGTHQVVASYPGDANYSKSISAATALSGGTITPVITWTPTVATIPYGTALGASQLDATATAAGVAVPGTFTYTPAAGTVLTAGSHTLSVAFAPTSTVYSAATGTATITVTQFTPVVTWATPNPITTTTPLSATQLDAAAKDINGVAVPGAFVYTPAAGSLLTAGTQTLSVTFTPTDTVDFATVTKTVSIVVSTATAAATTTSLTVTSGGSAVTTVVAGSVVTLTATVQAAGSNSVSPGQVVFCDATATTCTDNHLLATVQLVGGDTTSTATYKFMPGIGAHSYKAVFLGTKAAAGSASAATALSVTGKEATTTALAASGVEGNYALTATVDGLGLRSPTGNVVFTDSSTSTTLGTVTVTGVARGFLTGGAIPGAPVAVGSSPNQTIAIDINGDGKLDLVVANQSGTMVTVLIGNGDGTYTALPSFGTNYDGITGIAVADFNGDGKLDIATANQSTVGIFLGNGDGTFGPEHDFANTNTSAGVFPGDFNGDGIVDLAVPDRFNGMTILIGKGDGTFTQPNPAFAVGASPNYHSAVADFNGDGKLDIAAGNFFDNTVSILLGNGDGTFQAPVTYPTGLAPASTFAGDFNGDGIPDIFVTNSSGASVSVLLGKGDGTFLPQQSYAVGAYPNGGSIGDLNGDGKLDIAVANQNDGTVSVLYGNGDGTFQTQKVLASGAGTEYVAIGDVNGDGSMDLAASNSGDNTVTVFLNEATAAVSLTGVTLPGFGSDKVVAAYSGDTSFANSTSNTLTLLSSVVIAPTITWTPTVATIVYGTALGASQLNATATTATGVAIPGTFTYTPASGTVLGAGTQTLSVAFAPTSTDYSAATGSTTITVTKALPVITWATPAGIAYGTALSATQLDATVAGVGTGALAGTLVYTPALGTVLSPGTQTLSVTFTPADTVDYAATTGSVNLVVGGLSLSGISPAAAVQGSANTTLTLTGTGFVPTSVVQLGESTLVSTYLSPTMLTAVVPASVLINTGTQPVTVYDPSIEATSAAQTFTVVPAVTAATLTGPTTTLPGSQPMVGLTITNPYPLALTAVLNLTFASSGTTPVDDPSILFSNGTRSFSYVVAADSTTVPPVQLQAGTDAGTITITAKLTADGVDVTPAGLAPLVIVVPAVVPVLSGTTVTRSGNTLTVVIHGFSNTREVSQAVFDFTAATGDTLATPMVTIPATTIFSDWFVGDPTSVSYGSTFTYTQIFNTSADASTIGSVKVTLTNSVGASEASTGP